MLFRSLLFTFGGSSQYSNKISFPCPLVNSSTIQPQQYNSSYLREILSSNKDMNKGLIKISSEGMMVIEFENSTTKSKYWLIKNSTNE